MNIEIIYIVFIFIFGLVLGSFYNVVGYRLPNEMSIAFPSSHCPKCKHKLKFYELVPIFSYIFLGGKCKNCKSKISIMYPLFELITAVLFVISYLVFGFNIKFFISIIFLSVLIIISISDLKYYIIPDEVLIVGAVLIIILYLVNTYVNHLSIYIGVIKPILNALASFLFLFIFKFFGDKLFKKECLGGGDIKLMSLIGLVIGFDMSVVTIFLASFIALPLSIIALIKNDNNVLPFGPYLSIAASILFLASINLNMVLEFFVRR